jgi:hypothetical protein
MSDASALWNRIISLEGQTFQTKTGLPVAFRVGPGHIVPIRDGRELNRQIPQGDFVKALELMPLHGPGEIRDLVQGSAYVYAILTDRRVSP